MFPNTQNSCSKILGPLSTRMILSSRKSTLNFQIDSQRCESVSTLVLVEIIMIGKKDKDNVSCVKYIRGVGGRVRPNDYNIT